MARTDKDTWDLASSVGATVPDLPGCVAVAKTMDEARALMEELPLGKAGLMKNIVSH